MFRKSFLAAVAALACLAPNAAAAPDYDGDGATAGDCKPLDPAVHPGAVDRPDLDFEDLNCDGIDGDASRAFFVRDTGSNNNAGTAAAPFATIQFAVDQAAASATKKQVYVATGNYNEHVRLLTAADGVSIDGGYTGSDWHRTSGPAATRVAGSAAKPEAFYLQGATQVTMQLVSGQGATDNSLSAYGLRAVQGSEVSLVGVTLAAESGEAGSSGNSAFQPAAPQKAANGEQPPNCDTPGKGGTSSFPGNRGGSGGTGGEETNDGENGQAGTFGFPTGIGSGAPGAGGVDQDGDPTPDFAAMRGGDGQPGAKGADGRDGQAAPVRANDSWELFAGEWGVSGHDGVGGGGGGGGAGRGSATAWAAGPGGGQGGTGGSGGLSGTGGLSGGGSFAVYASNSKVIVTGGSSLTAGNGANGGAGGSGAAGGPGGQPGVGGAVRSDCRKTAGEGGTGGVGGDGGRGGNGGGGNGGPSVAVYRANGAVTTIKAGTALAHGTGGSGGTGPGNAGDGAAGLAADEGGTDNGVGDYDGDGITDGADACPDTPRGTTDANGDGCPDRPAALADGDGDGIPNVADACPGTPRGATDANEDGCPDGPTTTKPGEPTKPTDPNPNPPNPPEPPAPPNPPEPPAPPQPPARDVTAPALPLFTAARQKVLKTKAITLTAACSEDCGYALTAKLGGKPIGSATGRLAPAARTAIKVKLGKAALATVKTALKKKKSASVTLAFALTDGAGNKATVTKRVTIVR